jgi:proteasome lid subunit RPN8/RPN11
MSGVPIFSPAITRELMQLIVAARGLEVAGLLWENSAGEQRIQRAPNLHSEPGNVEIPGWWLERLLSRQDRSGFCPVAFFHSHTSSLDLSETDRASQRRMSLPWIVLMVTDDRLASAFYGPP